ncbi:DNA ligase 4 [Pisolithus orientalis]|uniref:DNA ligase 4 n=1 Tax=Pisolithus orientalis TaxID=936130 RepID=UPI0022247512|nr:DNA ligase 4 [Pisolithus orientalis]KAI6010699.1 DNA ligase 4 [Pisolithus orientalis]
MQPTPAPSARSGSPVPSGLSQAEENIGYAAPPQNRGSAPFSVLTGLFERLSTERKPERRRRMLSVWFNRWREEIGYDLYPVLRLILPQKDRERAVYGLKEKNIAKIYIKLIPLGMRDPDSIRLLNWKKPAGTNQAAGDFPTVLFDVVNKRSSVVEGSLTIDDLNGILDDLANATGKQVYMIISVKETTVFSVFHPDAEDFFNTCSDLKKVAWELSDPTRRLNPEDKSIQLFRAFAPMLCKRPTRNIEESVKEMQGRPFIIEEKLDGERMQLHRRGNEYFYCSRKGKDYTYLYGKHVGQGSLTPYIDAAFDERIDDIILDGEMLVWDPTSERLLPFGYLENCCTWMLGREWMRFMAARGEGLILKHPDSEYTLNGRNKDWIKVKPEYMDNLGETVDVLVVGGNYGSGKRSGGVATLLCAVLDDRNISDGDEPKYSTFVRVGSGLSFADYVWVRQKPWKEWDPKHPPDFLQTTKRGHEDKCDLYIEPADSFILEVKAAEITTSDEYHLGVTMRFPRALRIRDDLSIADCMYASAVLESMRAERKRKMEAETSVEDRRKKRRTTAKKPMVVSHFQGPDLKSVDVESNLFENMKFMVSADPKSRTGDEERKELMKIIHANGGTCVQVITPQQPAMAVYGGATTPYDIKLLMRRGTVDIIRPRWILDCIARGELLPLRKKYFFHASNDRQYSAEYDQPESDEDYEMVDGTQEQDADLKVPAISEGSQAKRKPVKDVAPALADWLSVDAKPATEESSETESETDADSVSDDVKGGDDEWSALEAGDGDILDETLDETQQHPQVHKAEEADLHVEDRDSLRNNDVRDATMGDDDAREYDLTFIFRHLCFYLDTPENARRHGMTVNTKHEKEISENLSKVSRDIEANGGRIVDLGDPKLTHVVLDKRDLSRRLRLIQETAKPKRRRLVVSEYITVCLEEETLLDEEEFAP